MELTLLHFDMQIVTQEALQDLSNMQNVFMRILQEDEDIIQADKDKSIEHISEDVIYEYLKNCLSVSQSEGTHQVLSVQ